MNSPEEIKAEYASSLGDLTFNSKPLINVLTMLADENSPNAKVIVEAIEEQLSKVIIFHCYYKSLCGAHNVCFTLWVIHCLNAKHFVIYFNKKFQSK